MRTIRGRYILEREIGRGATGSVWIAQDSQLRRQVAIKLLQSDCLEQTAWGARFEREARLVAQLRSPHVVQVYDAGIDGEQPFIVMELLEGESLEARLCRQELHRLPLFVVAGIVSDIARGLAITHRAKIIHRDLKPANIFLCSECGREVAKLLDFGVAALPSPLDAEALKIADVGGVVGTPAYMSPEQLAGTDPDERSDLWSLAVVAYQMLTAKTPFQGDSRARLEREIASGTFPRPSELIGELGPEVDAFFERGLAKDPSSRFQTSHELAAELVRVADGSADPTVRVLFLDDEPDMALLLRQHFRHRFKPGSYELFFGSDGEEGLQVLRTRPDIDVVFTDLNMPGMDGLTFLDRVADVNPPVPVVVISAYSDMANIRAAMNRGAFDFLCKPIEFDDLERTIHKCAGQSAVLRKALHSRRENSILRGLVGTGMADRLISSIKAADCLQPQVFEATVVFVGSHGFGEALASAGLEHGHARLNQHFELVVPELSSRRGRVNRFVDGAIFALFDGENHLARALGACTAIRERLRLLALQDGTDARGAAIGVDSGEVMVGGFGSLSLGRLEHTVIGEAVSVAAELQRLAKPHEILTSPRVLAAIRDDYACECATVRPAAANDAGVPVVKVGARIRQHSARDGLVAGLRDVGVNTPLVSIAKTGSA